MDKYFLYARNLCDAFCKLVYMILHVVTLTLIERGSIGNFRAKRMTETGLKQQDYNNIGSTMFGWK
jgi:hypothetical protein